MDKELHLTYEKKLFPQEMVHLFCDLVQSDETTKKIILFIGKLEKKRTKGEETITGITINEIIDNVQVERKTKDEKKHTYKYEITNLHRKTTEQQVAKLLNMSLLYYESVKPYKMLYLTQRGWQVIAELLHRDKQTKEQGAK
ncbi:hypothetical protein [Robertmurraya sp. FSL R5-0851]|uniref:hypothetical protein n=1 Tax=Robertmurraya sp. FSL R5-0851 TaxID=2921584 RepID=UPI0030F52CB9